MTIRYHPLSVLSVVVPGPLCGFAIPVAPRWENMRRKYTWRAVPANWESQGHRPQAPRLTFEPHRENALIYALYGDSDPRHPTHIFSNALPCTHVLTCAAAPLQTWRTPVKCGATSSATCSESGSLSLSLPHQDTLEFVNSWLEHPRRAILLHLNNTRRRLTDSVLQGSLADFDRPEENLDNLELT